MSKSKSRKEDIKHILEFKWGEHIGVAKRYAESLAHTLNVDVEFTFNTIHWVYHPDGSYSRYNKTGLIGTYKKE